MSNKSFELITIQLQNDTTFFNAVLCDQKGNEHIVFTYEQSKMLSTVRKRNTLLFEQMGRILGIDFNERNEDTIVDLLYEIVIVNLTWVRQGNTPYTVQQNDNGTLSPIVLDKGKLRELIYKDGFTITGIPGEPMDVVFRPFVSSASMARKGEYLFVRQDWIKPLMERLSLGLVSCNDEGHFKIQGLMDETGRHTQLSVAKLSAYLGLMLSDGVSIGEQLNEFGREYGFDEETLRQVEFSLDENSVVCVPDYNHFDMPLDQLGTYVWKSVPWDVNEDYQQPSLPDDTLADSASLVDLFERLTLPGKSNKMALKAWLSDEAGRRAIEAWKNCLKKGFCRDLPSLIGTDIPIPNLSAMIAESEVSNGQLYLCACILVLALNYKRMGQSGYLQSKKNAGYSTVGCVGRMEDASAGILLDATSLGDGSSILYAAIDELAFSTPADTTTADACSIDFALDALLNIVQVHNNHFLKIELSYDLEGNGMPDSEAESRTICFRLFARDPAGSNLMGAVLSRPDDHDRKTELYDGVGFCDEETFDKIERLLLCKKSLDLDKPRRFNGLIIRLPFVKGLLLRMDFLRYFENRKGSDGDEGTHRRIFDVFHHERRLYNDDGTPRVHIILTRSMFKFFQQWQLLDPVPEDGDLWAEYWRRVRALGFDLLVTQRNSTPKAISRLNYQFLSTLGLTSDDVENLVERMMENILQHVDDPSELLQTEDESEVPEDSVDFERYIRTADDAGRIGDGENTTAEKSDDSEVGDETDADMEESSREESEDSDFEALAESFVGSALLQACRKDSELFKSRYIRNLIHDKTWTAMIDAMYGRLDVNGDVRLLVPDLMAVLDYIGDRFVTPFRPDTEIVSPINGVGSGSAPVISGHGYYYAPDEKAPWKTTKDRMEICVLRNPHFAVGEDALLKPLDDVRWHEYDRWFSHLTGTVFLPGSAFLTINGADSDGDIGNVCCQPSVIRAARWTAKRNTELLSEVLKRRTRLLKLLRERRDSERSTKRSRYYSMLIKWLETSTPPDTITPDFIDGYCPTIVYAGSGSVAVKETPSELNTEVDADGRTYLEQRFWEVFNLTTEASIGLKSIQALNLASIAYARAIDDYCGLDDLSLIGLWLAHYRVVNCGLDTANAIDSAKTNRRYESLEIGDADPKMDNEILGLPRTESFFRQFRARSKKALNSRQIKREKAYEAVFDDVFRVLNRKLPQSGEVAQMKSDFALDHLPLSIYIRKPVGLRRCPPWWASASGWDGSPICEIADRFRPTGAAPSADLSTMLRKLVNRYSVGVTARRKAREQRDMLRKHYEIVVRHLMDCYPLSNIRHRLSLLLGDGTYQGSFIGRHYSSDAPHTQLKRMHQRLRDETLLAALAWSTPDARLYLLENQVFCRKAPEHDPEIVKMLTGSERGIYLLKAIVRYLLDAVDMDRANNTPASDVPRTPAGLRTQMLGAIAGFIGESMDSQLVQEIFCDECIRLASDKNLTDFLFIQLMEKALPNYASKDGDPL